jgi:hypothetical protein
MEGVETGLTVKYMIEKQLKKEQEEKQLEL